MIKKYNPFNFRSYNEEYNPYGFDEIYTKFTRYSTPLSRLKIFLESVKIESKYFLKKITNRHL